MIKGVVMDFKTLVKKRYSFRGYLQKEVEEDKISRIIECSRFAPSASNKQPWKIYIIKDKSVKKQMAESYQRDWFEEAPIMVAFIGLKDENWKMGDGEDYLLCDVTILADHFILAATEEGLGTCFIAAFDKEKAAQALNLPENEKVLLLTPLGYAKPDSTRERVRKSREEIVEYI